MGLIAGDDSLALDGSIIDSRTTEGSLIVSLATEGSLGGESGEYDIMFMCYERRFCNKEIGAQNETNSNGEYQTKEVQLGRRICM